MLMLPDKKAILNQYNFKYNFNREIYFNRSLKKIFSLEAIEDNNTQWLTNCIKTENVDDQWKFYFNAEPSDKIKEEILSIFKR